MGRVFLGESPSGRKVAIKVVHPHYASDPEFRRRFAREVAIARQVGGRRRAIGSGARPRNHRPRQGCAGEAAPRFSGPGGRGGQVTGWKLAAGALRAGLSSLCLVRTRHGGANRSRHSHSAGPPGRRFGNATRKLPTVPKRTRSIT